MARRRKKRSSSSGGSRRYQFGAMQLCPCAGGAVGGLGDLGVPLGAGHEDDPYRMPGVTDRFGSDRYRSGIELPGGGESLPLSPYMRPGGRVERSSTVELLKTLAALGATGAVAYYLYKKFVVKTPGASPERPSTAWTPQIPGVAANTPTDYVSAPG